MDETQKLTELIERHYKTRVLRLHLLANSWKKVYQLEHAGRPDWVVRAYPPPGYDGLPVDVAALATVLAFLEQQGYPAERMVRAADGSTVTQQEDWQVLITTFLSGIQQHWSPASGEFATTSPVEYGAEAYYALGAALGQLHMLPLDGRHSFPSAGMLPKRELTWVAGLLATIADRVPAYLQTQYDHLTAAVQHTARYEDLPLTLIHNDPNLDNVVLTPQGKIMLIDWETAGLGPAVLDVGVLLSNCFSKEQSRIRYDAITAIVDGYCQHRQLTLPELERLPDATRFMRLVLLAGYFPALIDQTLRGDELIYGATYTQWQAQYEASAEIAEIARKGFERYL